MTESLRVPTVDEVAWLLPEASSHTGNGAWSSFGCSGEAFSVLNPLARQEPPVPQLLLNLPQPHRRH